MIFWQKLYFKRRIINHQQTSKSAKISIGALCDIMKDFHVFDRNKLNDAFFVKLKMETNRDFGVSLKEMYGLNKRINQRKSHWKGSKIFYDINKIDFDTQTVIKWYENIVEDECNYDYNLNWILSENYKNAAKELQEYDFEIKKELYSQMFKLANIDDMISMRFLCQIINGLDIKICNEKYLETKEEFAFFFVYLKMKSLENKMNNDDKMGGKDDDDDDDDDEKGDNIKDKTQEIFDKAFDELFEKSDECDELNINNIYTMDIDNYCVHIDEFMEALFKSSKHRDRQTLNEIVNELYDKAVKVKIESNFDNKLKERITMKKHDPIYDGFHYQQVANQTQKDRKSKRKNKKKRKKDRNLASYGIFSGGRSDGF